MKKSTVALFMLLVTGLLLVMGGIKNLKLSESNMVFLLSGVEAFAQDEAWTGKKLKDVTCSCNDGSGKTGFSVKCRNDGTLESCSATQQGSASCYTEKSMMGVTIGLKKACKSDNNIEWN